MTQHKTSDELVERVARAICESDGFAPTELWEGTLLWDRYKDSARAAIAAMPDAERMREALREVAACMLNGADGGDYGWNISRLTKARPMIRAALGERP